MCNPVHTSSADEGLDVVTAAKQEMQIRTLGRGQPACSGKGQGVNDSGSAGREVSVALLSCAARGRSSQAGVGAAGGLCAREATPVDHWHRRTARPERRV